MVIPASRLPRRCAPRNDNLVAGNESKQLAAAIDRYLELTAKAKKWSGLYFAEKAVPAPISAIAGLIITRPLVQRGRR